jgi:hypothetical protein
VCEKHTAKRLQLALHPVSLRLPSKEIPMAMYAIRVELHRASEADYERLHVALAAIGLRRIARFGDTLYALPPAEYECEAAAPATVLSICNEVGAVARTIKAAPAVVVTEIAAQAALGLKPANALAVAVGAPTSALTAAPTSALAAALANARGLGAASSWVPGNAMRDLARKG